MSPSKVPWRGSGKHLVSEDEKDKRIRELSLELYNERQKCKRRCTAYEEQLNMILKDLEKHTEHISGWVMCPENMVKHDLTEHHQLIDAVWLCHGWDLKNLGEVVVTHGIHTRLKCMEGPDWTVTVSNLEIKQWKPT
ncbi:hypothetical protein F0562_006101 [Nyssa sinensis]|uniref:Uncharacterized protein n=1 Tax=Nyssa sinensis TaxID=561372 RepID=A0A5J5AK29_9ASTE|nr:hypothetical protein F0562_006101 [Nyssa sinensis]